MVDVFCSASKRLKLINDDDVSNLLIPSFDGSLSKVLSSARIS